MKTLIVEKKDLVGPVCDFVTPPECFGQMVERSYALIEGAILVATCDHGEDGRTTIEAYEDGDDGADFEPWNCSPQIGKKIADVVFVN